VPIKVTPALGGLWCARPSGRPEPTSSGCDCGRRPRRDILDTHAEKRSIPHHKQPHGDSAADPTAVAGEAADYSDTTMLKIKDFGALSA
jgi:hypothetical protein